MKFLNCNRHEDQIAELRYEIAELKDHIKSIQRNNEIRIVLDNDRIPAMWSWRDVTPRVSVRDVVMLLVDHLGLKIKQTPQHDATTILAKKEDTTNIKKGIDKL